MSETLRRIEHIELLQAVALANRAPSIHNTQPWRWRIGNDRADLFADRSRQLPVVDPAGRALLLSCGAALFHLRVALSASGWASSAMRMPNMFDADHLATVWIAHGNEPSHEWNDLAGAARRRRTDRRPFAEQPVDEVAVERLRTAALVEGGFLHKVVRQYDRNVLSVAIGRADDTELADPRYRSELAEWTCANTSDDGVPATSILHSPDPDWEMPIRDFGVAAPGRLYTSTRSRRGRDVMFILATSRDDPVDRLRAGESLAHVLLAGTQIGLAMSPYTQPVEVPESRMLLRRLLRGFGEPQIVLRVGWPGPGPEPPLTHRRATAEVIDDTFV